MLNIVGILVFIAYFLIIFYVIIKSKVISGLDNREDERDTLRMQSNKELAADIIDEFEELLREKDIMLPNEDRENNEDEACIYGGDYYDLEDRIIELLNNRKGK